MRGKNEGNGEAAMNARMRVNHAVEHSYEVTCESSNTLQNGGHAHTKALRASLIEATVQAISEGSHPRLARTLVLA